VTRLQGPFNAQMPSAAFQDDNAGRLRLVLEVMRMVLAREIFRGKN
jgi:hypothetical protein